MTGVDWKRALPLLRRLLELPDAEHESFLHGACEGDEALADTLRRLIAEDRRNPSLLDGPFRDVDRKDRIHGTAVLADLRAGDRIGCWIVESPLGAGGMGEVWLARRDDLGQRAAIKLLRAGLGSGELLERFERERRFLASLEHPNIARLIDGGKLENGHPWLAMEYVAGQPIDEYCRAQSLDVRERVRLLLPIFDAVAAAHRQLIVHRDLKPSNVMVQGDGTPKLLDFGIAKALEEEGDATQTHPDKRPMTPRYASPEQLAGEKASTLSDVYSLGVLLYELLTTVSPYGDTTSSVALWRAVQDREPTRPSSAVRVLDASQCAEFGADADLRQWSRGVLKELDWIVLKALRKEPARRYASVERFADDLTRFLAGHPVDAGPDSWRYRASKFVRRNRLASLAVVIAVLALVGGSLAASLSAARTRRAAREETQALAAASDAIAFLEQLVLSGSPNRGGGKETLSIDALRATQASIDRLESPYARLVTHAIIGGAFGELGEGPSAIAHMSAAVELADSLDESGAALATLCGDLAHQLEIVGRDEEAVFFGRRAVAALESEVPSKLDKILRRESGAKERAMVLNSLAIALEGTGDTDRAIALFQEARQVLRDAGDPVGEEALILEFNLICSQLQQGDFDNCIANLEALNGDTEQASLSTRIAFRSGFGHVLCLMDQSGRAEPILRSCVDLARREFSPEHPMIWDAELSLARALLLNGELEECEELARSLRTRPEAADGRAQLAQLGWVQGLCWTRMGRAADAEALLAPLIADAEALWQDDLGEHGLLRMAWCECLARLGREDEARAELERAVTLFERYDCRACPFPAQAARLGRELGLTDD